MNSNLTKPHLYQLLLLVVLFIIVLIVTVLIYTETMLEKKEMIGNKTTEEIKAEVERNFGTPIELSAQEKMDVEKNFGGSFKK